MKSRNSFASDLSEIIWSEQVVDEIDEKIIEQSEGENIDYPIW